MARTRSELKTFAIREIHGGDPNETAVARVEDALEDALSMLMRKRDWGHHQTLFDFVTIAPYDDGTVSVNTGSKAVTSVGATFPTDIVGQRIEFNSERHWYEITKRGGNTSLTILNPYSNDLSGVDYRIVYPLYDLPENFRRLAPGEPALFDVDSGADSYPYTEMGLMQMLQATRSQGGRTEGYGIQAVRHNPEQYQVYLYPAPTDTRRFQMVYFRRPGWWSSTDPDATWKSKADADTDVVDWPGQHDDVLNAAIMAAVAKRIKPDRYQDLLFDFERIADTAANLDQRNPGPIRLSRKVHRRRGMYARYT